MFGGSAVREWAVLAQCNMRHRHHRRHTHSPSEIGPELIARLRQERESKKALGMLKQRHAAC
jgi:hypothetical protein